MYTNLRVPATRLICFVTSLSVLLQFKDLIRENKLLANVSVFNIILRNNKHGDLLFVLACRIQH